MIRTYSYKKQELQEYRHQRRQRKDGKFFTRKREFLTTEYESMMSKMSQTVMDVEGLNSHMKTMDMDLKAISQVAESASY